MTDQPCIRGCTQKCREEHEHDHEPIGRMATEGFLCSRCADQLRGRLNDIPDLYAQLDLRPQSGSGQGGNRRTKISGSPALIRLDVMALQDPRTRIGVEMKAAGKLEDVGYQHYETTVHVPTAILQWAQVLIDDNELASEPKDLTAAVGLLITWFSTVCASPWVDEMWDDVRRIHSTLWRTTDQEQPVGRCFGWDPTRPCGAPLYPDDEGVIRCTRKGCERGYSGLDILKLQLQAEREQGA